MRNTGNFTELIVEGTLNADGVTVWEKDINMYVILCTGSGAPPSGKSYYQMGCIYVRQSNGAWYYNTGSTSSCTFTLVGTVAGNSITTAMLQANAVTSGKIDTNVIQTDKITISATDIVSGTTMKQLVAAPASGSYLQLLSCTIAYTFGTAAYTGGGNVTIALGTTAITGLISAANSFGKGSSAVIQFVPLAVAAIDISALTATALNINVASTAFTQPGTAAGTAVAYVTYQIHTTT